MFASLQVNEIITIKDDDRWYVGADIFYIGVNVFGLLMAFFLYCWDMRKGDGVLNWPVYYYYDYDEEEEGEEEDNGGGVNDDNKSSMSRLKPKKKDSTTSGMSFNSNVRS